MVHEPRQVAFGSGIDDSILIDDQKVVVFVHLLVHFLDPPLVLLIVHQFAHVLDHKVALRYRLEGFQSPTPSVRFVREEWGVLTFLETLVLAAVAGRADFRIALG